MAGKRIYNYKLYTGGPGQTIYSSAREYGSGMWIAEVRAKSIEQAYWLLAHQRIADGDGVGVVGLDNSHGPGAGWPWASRDLYPEHWRA